LNQAGKARVDKRALCRGLIYQALKRARVRGRPTKKARYRICLIYQASIRFAAYAAGVLNENGLVSGFWKKPFYSVGRASVLAQAIHKQ
jgi:hypothetical protein